MRYLVHAKNSTPFLTDIYDQEKWCDDIIVIYDIYKNKYTTDGQNWFDIELDHL